MPFDVWQGTLQAMRQPVCPQPHLHAHAAVARCVGFAPADDASDRKALLEGAVAHFDHVYYSSMAFSIIGTLLWFPDVWSYIYVRITAEGDEKLESLRVAALVSVLVFIAEDFPQTVCP